MGERERLHRLDPDRTAPDRNFSRLFKQSDAATRGLETGDKPPRFDSAQDTPTDDTVTDGVKLAYSVIEEEIRKQIGNGQRVAQQLNERLYGREAANASVSDIYQRLLRFSSEFGSLYMELLDTVAKTTLFEDLLRTQTGSQSAKRSGGEDTKLAIELVASRPVEVNLNVWSTEAKGKLLPQALRSLDASLEPLTDIHVEYEEGHPVKLRVVVPDDQPVSVYTGLVVDSESNEPKGSISLRIVA